VITVVACTRGRPRESRTPAAAASFVLWSSGRGLGRRSRRTAVQQPLELGRRLGGFHFSGSGAERFRQQLSAQVGQPAEQREQFAADVAAVRAADAHQVGAARQRRGRKADGLAERVVVASRQRPQLPRPVAARQAPPPLPPQLLVVLVARSLLLLAPLGEQLPYLRTGCHR